MQADREPITSIHPRSGRSLGLYFSCVGKQPRRLLLQLELRETASAELEILAELLRRLRTPSARLRH
jgi:hypothetical protein